MKKYSTLIIDLKKSRSYRHADRIDIQNYIKNIISVLNKVFENVLELKVVFSAGDEIQGLFSSSQSAYLYFRLFNMLISPVEIRAGIGVGEWSVKIESGSSTEQDGPAYYNARHAIENVDDQLGYSLLLFSGSSDDIYINSAINSAMVFLNNQSEYQNELSLLTELMYPIEIDGAIIKQYIGELIPLIAQKNSMRYYEKWYSSRSIANNSFLQKNIDIECNLVNALTEEKQFYVSLGKVKGLPSKLAKIMGTSRQNIDKSIKAGNIYQERNATIAALKLMSKIMPED